MRTLENEEFDELRVSFLKQYTIGGLQCLKNYFDKLVAEHSQLASTRSNFKQQSKKVFVPQIPSQNYLSLQIFWKIGQEENTLAPLKIKEQAINALIEILSSIQNY